MAKPSGSLYQEGLTFQDKISQKYTPRSSGQGQRPSPPKGEKVAGKFTIK